MATDNIHTHDISTLHGRPCLGEIMFTQSVFLSFINIIFFGDVLRGAFPRQYEVESK